MNFKYYTILAILLFVIGCRSISDFGSEKSATQNFMINDGILYSLNINQSTFSIYDTLIIKYEVKNISIEQKTFYFSVQQQFGFKLIGETNQVAMLYPAIVQPASSKFSLNPGETKEFIYSGEFKDLEGNYIDIGNYKLVIFLSSNYPEVILSLNINLNSASII